VTNICLIRSLLNKTAYELLTNKKPKLNYFWAFGSKCFVLNNGKNDLRKFDPRSDEGVFVGYSFSSKTYRVFNKRTLCIEESVHVVFDESGDLKNLELKGDDDLEELFKIQKDEINGSPAEGSQNTVGTSVGESEKVNEADKSYEGSGPSNNADQEESPQSEYDDSKNEEEQTDQPQPLSSKSR